VGVHNDSVLVRSYTTPPGTPKDRVQILRRAFQATLNDPAFLAEAEKARLEIAPVTGEEIERTVANLFKLDPAMTAKLRTILLE
jgi:tripartite-type tricarboxylate transporter receptor subunit TctC